MYAALATKWREHAKDALDTLVLNAVDKVVTIISFIIEVMVRMYRNR